MQIYQFYFEIALRNSNLQTAKNNSYVFFRYEHIFQDYLLPKGHEKKVKKKEII